MTNKPFNQNVFQSSDPQSRQAAIAFFHKVGFDLRENENKYGIDLMSTDGRIKVELEQRSIWHGTEFPYSSIHVPGRKAKFIIQDTASYAVLNADFSCIMVCLNEELRRCEHTLTEIPNTAVRSGEFFYDVPARCFAVYSTITGEKIS